MIVKWDDWKKKYKTYKDKMGCYQMSWDGYEVLQDKHNKNAHYVGMGKCWLTTTSSYPKVKDIMNIVWLRRESC